MKLQFQIESDHGANTLTVDIHTFIVAGWAGRDQAAIESRIEALASIGVARPSAVPLYYRIADNQLTQSAEVQVLGGASSGEAEVFVFSAGGELYVSLVSDHTDRLLETRSVAFSKQACAKPVATTAWRYADVIAHWDELLLRTEIEEDGRQVVYQEGALAMLRTPQQLMDGYGTAFTDGTGMSCGTVAALGGIRPSKRYAMSLVDPKLGRTLSHRYAVLSLPVVA